MMYYSKTIPGSIKQNCQTFHELIDIVLSNVVWVNLRTKFEFDEVINPQDKDAPHTIEEIDLFLECLKKNQFPAKMTFYNDMTFDPGISYVYISFVDNNIFVYTNGSNKNQINQLNTKIIEWANKYQVGLEIKTQSTPIFANKYFDTKKIFLLFCAFCVIIVGYFLIPS